MQGGRRTLHHTSRNTPQTEVLLPNPGLCCRGVRVKVGLRLLWERWSSWEDFGNKEHELHPPSQKLSVPLPSFISPPRQHPWPWFKRAKEILIFSFPEAQEGSYQDASCFPLKLSQCCLPSCATIYFHLTLRRALWGHTVTACLHLFKDHPSSQSLYLSNPTSLWKKKIRKQNPSLLSHEDLWYSCSLPGRPFPGVCMRSPLHSGGSSDITSPPTWSLGLHSSVSPLFFSTNILSFGVLWKMSSSCTSRAAVHLVQMIAACL